MTAAKRAGTGCPASASRSPCRRANSASRSSPSCSSCPRSSSSTSSSASSCRRCARLTRRTRPSATETKPRTAPCPADRPRGKQQVRQTGKGSGATRAPLHALIGTPRRVRAGGLTSQATGCACDDGGVGTEGSRRAGSHRSRVRRLRSGRPRRPPCFACFWPVAAAANGHNTRRHERHHSATVHGCSTYKGAAAMGATPTGDRRYRRTCVTAAPCQHGRLGRCSTRAACAVAAADGRTHTCVARRMDAAECAWSLQPSRGAAAAATAAAAQKQLQRRRRSVCIGRLVECSQLAVPGTRRVWASHRVLDSAGAVGRRSGGDAHVRGDRLA
mmetsp:Transcript_33194/g.98864  ORF Transcript_33194/g.98864 Transcript_33194/m.98864 type:complete len:330 (+) Transcript_33194:117-1106(+)